MIDYLVIGVFFGINLIIYLGVTLVLDIKTYTRPDQSKMRNEEPSYKMNYSMIVTFLTSLYMWILFLVVPIDAIIGLEFFYSPLEFVGDLFILLGFIIILLGTIIACWGRISRGKRAFSWGVPTKLETEGMYQYIRHPLYASYIYYFIGFNLVLQSLLVIPLLVGIYGYYEISKYEEDILTKYFGEAYESYQKKTGRFFPRFRF